MKDFASYDPGKGNSEDLLREAEDVLKAFGGRADGDILKEIYARALEGKRNGTLTNEQIDFFCERLSPMLDGAKRKRLKALAEKLKSM